MFESLINECMKLELNFDFNATPSVKESTSVDKEAPVKPDKAVSKPQKSKKMAAKHREPRINQKYKQTINPSKRHRDRLNSELENLAKLLPFPEDVIARLDKLSILRLSVSFLRNKNFFKAAIKKHKDSQQNSPPSNVNRSDANRFSSYFNDALDGFILVVTLEGEIFFASESVKNYLGYSQSSVLHQPLESFVHDDDKDELIHYLKGSSHEKIVELNENDEEIMSEEYSGEEREFVVRLKSVLNNGTSDMYKPFKISGRIRRMNMQPDINNLKYALFAFCTPARTSLSVLEIRMKTTLFCSKNRIDLSFLDLDARGKEYFGYSKKDIFGRSSYVMIHRYDYQHVRCKHTEIMTCGKTSVGTFRLMNKNNEWNWISGYGRVMYKNGKPDFLVTTNRILSDEEGMAMMKIRDQADYKALEKLGLIEPDDPADALELGFPNRSPASSMLHQSSSEHAIPMPLGELPQTEKLINAHMRSGSMEKLFGNEEEMQQSSSQLSPAEENTIRNNEIYKPPVYSPSNHSSNHSMLSDNVSHMSINSSPANITPSSYEQNVPMKNETNTIEFTMSQGVQRALSLGSSSTCESNQGYQQAIANDNISQQFSMDMFDDIPTDLTNSIPQPPPQPRFSFLPPVTSNGYPSSTNLNENVRLCSTEFPMYNQTAYNMTSERLPNVPFMPHLMENYGMPTTPQHQQHHMEDWMRQTANLHDTFPPFVFNNKASPSSSGGDANSTSSAHFNDTNHHHNYNYQ